MCHHPPYEDLLPPIVDSRTEPVSVAANIEHNEPSHLVGTAERIAELTEVYRYLRLSRAGKASVVIDAAPNQVVRASYRAPTSVLIAASPGTLTVEPTAGQSAALHPLQLRDP